MITPQLLEELGFQLLMSDYWRKGNYGLLRSFDGGKITFINFNSVMTTLEELKEDYKKKEGKELW